MPTLHVDLPANRYRVEIGSGLLLSSLLADTVRGHQAILVTNATLWPLYGESVFRKLRESGAETTSCVLPDGEAHKDWATLDRIHDAMLQARLDRQSLVIALGGGVVGDLAGFAAATYQRGTAVVQVPTSLLAQVDSAIGGKTAINHARGKNMIGAFHQPSLVLIDPCTLATLPDREYRSGLAEIIKYGLIRDPDFLVWLEEHIDLLANRDTLALEAAIFQSCRNKAEVVAADEREAGERALLNLGHTFGHAIEAALGYGEWLHGEAVATGIVLAARLSHELGHLNEAELGRVLRLITRAGLPVSPPHVAAPQLIEFMAVDKKNEAGQLRFVLLRALGQAYVERGITYQQATSFLERHLPR